MNIKLRNTSGEIISAVIAIAWMYPKLNTADNMSIASITQVLIQGIGISILVSILLAIAISVFSSIVTGRYEKNIADERDSMIELYAMRLMLVLFSIFLVIILILLGWFSLHINFGIVAITLSLFLANIISNFLKIYFYK